METKVNCPYCGKEILNNSEQCEFCNEFFVEPHIDGLKHLSLTKFIIFEVLTLGLYSLLWVTFNNIALKKLATKADYRKFVLHYLFLFISIIGLWFCNITLFLILRKVSLLFLSYRILRIVEKYSSRKYKAPIFHNEYGWFFFDMLYVVYYLEMFAERVNMPTKQFYLDTKGWLKYSSLFLLVIIFLIILVYLGLLFNISQ